MANSYIVTTFCVVCGVELWQERVRKRRFVFAYSASRVVTEQTVPQWNFERHFYFKIVVRPNTRCVVGWPTAF